MKKTRARKNLIRLVVLLVLMLATIPTSAANVTSVKFLDANDNFQDQIKLSLYAGSGTTLRYGYSKIKGSTVDKNSATWSSTNPSVASVSKGYVNAKKAGKATITVTLEGKTAECEVTVKPLKPIWVNTSQAYTYLNNYRKKAKLGKLKKDKKLEKIAKTRAKEMAVNNKFSHTRPNGKSGLTLIKGNKWKGENIAKGQTTCSQVSQGWYNSPGHRANMLRKQFKKVGIACYKYNGVTYWAQCFSN